MFCSKETSLLATVHAAVNSFSLREIMYLEELSCDKRVDLEHQNIQQGYSRDSEQLMTSFCLLCYQLDGNGDGEPGVLMTAQTITSESLCTTTTTHITKVQTPRKHTHILFLSPPTVFITISHNDV